MSEIASPVPQPSRRHAAVFLCILAGVALIGSWNAVNPVDFYQFWFVSRTNLHNVDRPYSHEAQATLSAIAEQRLESGQLGELEQRTLAQTRELFEPLADGRMIQSTGTPMLYATAALIATDSFEVAGRIAHAVILISYIASLLMLAKLLRLSNSIIFAAWFMLWAFFLPASFDVFFGNVAGFQMAMLLASVLMLTDRRYASAGLLAAVAALFKPTAAYPVIAMSVYVVARCDWRATARFVIGGLSGGLVAIGLTTWSFGTPMVWVDWFTLMLPQVAETSYAVGNGNCGLNAFWTHYTGERPTLLLTAVTFAPALVAAALRGWSDRNTVQAPEQTAKIESAGQGPIWVLSLSIAAMLLSAPLTWQHYYVLLVPGIVAAATRKASPSLLLAVITLVCLSRLSFVGIGGTGMTGALFSTSLYCIAAASIFLASMLATVEGTVVHRAATKTREIILAACKAEPRTVGQAA